MNDEHIPMMAMILMMSTSPISLMNSTNRGIQRFKTKSIYDIGSAARRKIWSSQGQGRSDVRIQMIVYSKLYMCDTYL